MGFGRAEHHEEQTEGKKCEACWFRRGQNLTTNFAAGELCIVDVEIHQAGFEFGDLNRGDCKGLLGNGA